MRIELKHNACEVKEGTAVLFVNIEDFMTMLDTVNPKILSDYLCTRMKPKVKAETIVQSQKSTP